MHSGWRPANYSWVGRFTAALATSDTVNLVRLPANHRVTGLKFQFSEADSGTTVTVNVGAQATGDL